MPAITTPEYSLPPFDTKLDGKENNYSRRRWRSLFFHLVCSSVCLTVCLSVCRIVDEFLRILGEVGCMTSISSLDFGGDMAHDAKTEIKKCHFRIEALQRILLIIQERIIMKCAGGVECLTSNKPFDWCWFGSRSGSRRIYFHFQLSECCSISCGGAGLPSLSASDVAKWTRRHVISNVKHALVSEFAQTLSLKKIAGQTMSWNGTKWQF